MEFLQGHLKEYCLIYQFVYATFFLKCYVLNDKYRITIKSKFSFCY